jgi:hypothetical protein
LRGGVLGTRMPEHLIESSDDKNQSARRRSDTRSL